MSEITRGSRGFRLLDWLLIVLISLGAGLASQRWTGFNSPDSEFYASLALFGDEVTSRSEPAYTWTRLGYIAPVRFLVTTFDPWLGFAIWRFVLIALIVGSLYAMARMVSTRQVAAIVAAFASLNTVVLSYVGNSYLTGTAIAATLLLVALGAWRVLTTPRVPWLVVLLSGGVVAWLVMVNPYAALLALTMWLALRTIALWADGSRRWILLLQDVIAAIIGFAVVFATFLIAGLAIFKGRSWFGTYLEWNSALDYASFIGDATTWQRDIALLVPVVAVLLGVVTLVATRSRAGVAATVVPMASIVFTVGYILLVPGPWLESPTYVAKLWAGALAGVALGFAALVRHRSLGLPGWLLALAFVPLLIWAGRWDRDIPVALGVVIALVMLALVIIAAWSLRGEGHDWTGVLVVLAIGVVALGSQLLQNGRGFLGTYGQFPFRAAYVDFDAEMLMRSKVAAEEFVLSNTTRGEKVMMWTDPDRLTAGIAGMQLWGWYNNVPEEPVLTTTGVQGLTQARPDAIVMYAPTRDQIDAFRSSLPPWSMPTDPVCTTVPFLGIGSPEAHVCVTHLRWIG